MRSRVIFGRHSIHVFQTEYHSTGPRASSAAPPPLFYLFFLYLFFSLVKQRLAAMETYLVFLYLFFSLVNSQKRLAAMETRRGGRSVRKRWEMDTTFHSPIVWKIWWMATDIHSNIVWKRWETATKFHSTSLQSSTRPEGGWCSWRCGVEWNSVGGNIAIGY